MLDAQRISVVQQGGAHGATLSCDVVTASGSAPHRVLALPKEPGWTSYTYDVQLER